MNSPRNNDNSLSWSPRDGAIKYWFHNFKLIWIFFLISFQVWLEKSISRVYERLRSSLKPAKFELDQLTSCGAISRHQQQIAITSAGISSLDADQTMRMKTLISSGCKILKISTSKIDQLTGEYPPESRCFRLLWTGGNGRRHTATPPKKMSLKNQNQIIIWIRNALWGSSAHPSIHPSIHWVSSSISRHPYDVSHFPRRHQATINRNEMIGQSILIWVALEKIGPVINCNTGRI